MNNVTRVYLGVYGTILFLAASLAIAWGNPISVLLGILLVIGGIGAFSSAMSEETSTEEASQPQTGVREHEVVRETVYVVREADGRTRIEGRVIDGDIVDERPIPVRSTMRAAPPRRH